MAFATPAERVSLREQTERQGFPLTYVIQFSKNGLDSELPCDDSGHALDLQAHWIDNGNADYVEIFRVLSDGEINSTCGPFFRRAQG